MEAIKHKDYQEELKSFNDTLNYVKEVIEELDVLVNKLDKDTSSGKYSGEASDAFTSLMVESNLYYAKEKYFRNILRIKDAPYFSRVDFNPMEKGKESYYIGKCSVIDDETQDPIVIDWRAPVANLYYEGRLGDASYNCPDGNISGELSLKRQYVISNRELKEIVDVDIATNDEFLQACLGATSDNRLKEIVSTIQGEQNRIIRAPMWTPLIVQGVAGSGKTTIALHRIAYLIYSYEKKMKASNFMIIAPNKLFLNYISDILPDLGVDDVNQKTYEELAKGFIKDKYKLINPNEKLYNIIEEDTKSVESERNANHIFEISSYKTSMKYKEEIDKFLEKVEKNLIPKESFKINSTTIYTKKEVKNLFLVEFEMYPMEMRFNEIKKTLTNRAKMNKAGIIYNYEQDFYEKIDNIKEEYPDNEERRNLIMKLYSEKDEFESNLGKNLPKEIKKYLKKEDIKTPTWYYKEFLSNLKQNYQDDLLIGNLVDNTLKNISSGYLEHEDLAAIMYIKYNINGIIDKNDIKQLVIDEAQDCGVFQLYVLKKIFKNSSFTILGDINQGIFSYRGINDWKDVSENVFVDKKSDFQTLEQSYRTTVEIMDVANNVIKKIPGNDIFAKPVLRHGEKVNIIEKENMDKIVEDIDCKIQKYINDGLSTIAIICKNNVESAKIHKILNKKIGNITLLKDNETVYPGGIVVLPVYLAKGLEFDGVFIVNANSENYSSNILDIKLLYVAITRALHKLNIYYEKKVTTLLK